jgi:hypothetical protein
VNNYTDVVVNLDEHIVGNDGYCARENCYGVADKSKAVNYIYDETLDGYVASSLGNFNQTKVYISEYYNDGIHGKKAVKKIGDGLFDNMTQTTIKSNLTHVYLPDTITEIGGSAFRLCEKLKFVKMSANISTIASSAFQSCHSLEAMVIHKSLNCTTGPFNGGGSWQNAKMNIYAMQAGGTVNITNNGKPLFTGKVYVYSEDPVSGGWHYVDDVPMPWDI